MTNDVVGQLAFDSDVPQVKVFRLTEPLPGKLFNNSKRRIVVCLYRNSNGVLFVVIRHYLQKKIGNSF